MIGGGANSYNVTLWNLTTGNVILTMSGHTNGVLSIKTINNQTIASSSFDHTIKIWNITQGTCIYTLTAHTNTVGGIEFLSTGYLVSSKN